MLRAISINYKLVEKQLWWCIWDQQVQEQVWFEVCFRGLDPAWRQVNGQIKKRVRNEAEEKIDVNSS